MLPLMVAHDDGAALPPTCTSCPRVVPVTEFASDLVRLELTRSCTGVPTLPEPTRPWHRTLQLLPTTTGAPVQLLTLTLTIVTDDPRSPTTAPEPKSPAMAVTVSNRHELRLM